VVAYMVEEHVSRAPTTLRNLGWANGAPLLPNFGTPSYVHNV